VLDFPPVPDSIPEVPEAPSQSDSFAGRPDCQRQFKEVWPQVLYPQAADGGYRRLYHFLQSLVDAAIMRVLDALESHGLADDTIVVFTSDHGDLLGAHGGLMQKWHNAFDEAVHVPLLISGPGIDTSAGDVQIPTSHLDLLPTLLGLVGADVEEAAHIVSRHHVETQPLVGRDLTGLLAGSQDEESVDAPVYFMTEDQITMGLRTVNLFSGEPFDPVGEPSKVESVITHLPTGEAGARELWKYNRYYDQLDGSSEIADEWELHNLTVDPEERANLIADAGAAPALDQLRTLLDDTRSAKRRTPEHVNS
jgi:Sulfatase